MQAVLNMINIFKKPKPKDIVQEQLEEYQRKLMESEAAAAYHAKMGEFYKEGITRLQKYKH